MTDLPTAYMPVPLHRTAPDSPDASASMEWVLAFTDEHVVERTAGSEMPMMAAAWALGFVGAPRVQVWWVLRDERLHRAYGLIVRALGRVPVPGAAAWTDPVMALRPSARAAVAAAVDRLPAAERTRIGARDAVLLELCRAHPQSATAPDGRLVAVPRGAVEELAVAARSVTAADIAALLQQARGPFGDRLAEAARVGGDPVTTFHARRPDHRVA